MRTVMTKIAVFLVVMLATGAAYGQMTPERLSRLADSMVKVETTAGIGSGTVIGNDLVLTCAHVVKSESIVLVETRLADGESHVRKAQVIKLDAKEDLALLKVPGLGLESIKVAGADAPDFSMLYEITAPLGHMRTVSLEVLNKTAPNVDNGWRLTGSAYVGSSGGGVLDAAGELQCVFARLWSAGGPFAGMSECIDRSTVVKFLARK